MEPFLTTRPCYCEKKSRRDTGLAWMQSAGLRNIDFECRKVIFKLSLGSGVWRLHRSLGRKKSPETVLLLEGWESQDSQTRLEEWKCGDNYEFRGLRKPRGLSGLRKPWVSGDIQTSGPVHVQKEATTKKAEKTWRTEGKENWVNWERGTRTQMCKTVLGTSKKPKAKVWGLRSDTPEERKRWREEEVGLIFFSHSSRFDFESSPGVGNYFMLDFNFV